jgi:predicted RNA-binding protein with PIN domain
VATSDALEQVIILGGGALRVPASAFEQEVKEVESAIRGFLQG